MNIASSKDNVQEKLLYVATFVVSGYASTASRAMRKPMNPLLGETFEFILPEKGDVNYIEKPKTTIDFELLRFQICL